MDINFHTVGVEWIKSIDFDAFSLGVRDERLQCRMTELPELGWTVFNFLSPMQRGLWLLRVYKQFDAGLREVFFVQKEGEPDDDRLKAFESFLKRQEIPKKSETSYRCFGLYPHLWGHRFSPPKLNALAAHRLLSVAVPSARAAAARDYFVQQAADFGDRLIAPASETETLFITGPGGSEESRQDGRLLLDLISRMSDAERAEVLSRLRELLASNRALEAFERSLDPGMKFAGAFRAPDPRDIAPGAAEDCVEIAKLRVRLMCRLRWPHALEFVQSTLNDTRDGVFADVSYEIRSTLAEFPSVGVNPLPG